MMDFVLNCLGISRFSSNDDSPSPDSSENPFLRFLPKKRLQRIAGIAPDENFTIQILQYLVLRPSCLLLF
jgi:hypothetical protein